MSDNLAVSSAFGDLVQRVQACRKCPRMTESARVLGFGCGPIGARLMVVGEAPGRLGADESLMPFHGDQAGRNFESLIDQVGLSRYDLFVTNAVLCNPKDGKGNNATPTPAEIANCASFLREQIEILRPEVVVSLGSVALRATASVDAHSLDLRTSVRTIQDWFGRKLIPLYHPGQRAMVHRSFANQLADYQFVAEVLRRGGKRKSKSSRRPRTGSAKSAAVVRRILEEHPNGLTYFALHKLYFLSEVAYLEAVGERLSNAYIVRQKDGPYCVDLHLSRLKLMIPDLDVRTVKGEVWLALSPQRTFSDERSEDELSDLERKIVDHTVSRNRGASNVELKRRAYLSLPMREVLRKERRGRKNLFNIALLPQQSPLLKLTAKSNRRTLPDPFG